MNHHELLNELDRRISARSILQHPFYLAWQRGELTRDQLAAYAAIYYPHVAAFPRYLEMAVAQTDDPAIRDTLLDNLADELAEPRPHPEMWLDFAAEFDLDAGAVASSDPHPAAQAIVNTFERLAARDIASGITALYAYESQQPAVSHQKGEGLRRFYGVDDPRSLAYFEVHAEADVEHSAGERQALARCLEAGTGPDVILAAADEALDAYWGLLDGVCAAADIPLDC